MYNYKYIALFDFRVAVIRDESAKKLPIAPIAMFNRL
jgi:hypothetical protein